LACGRIATAGIGFFDGDDGFVKVVSKKERVGTLEVSTG
jgi:hypothetical protein